jgi:hypothetical protein
MLLMAEKDNVKIQRERITSTVKSIDPALVVIFDEDAGFNKIRFRIESSTGDILTRVHETYHVSIIADMSDEQLSQLIKNLTGNRI